MVRYERGILEGLSGSKARFETCFHNCIKDITSWDLEHLDSSLPEKKQGIVPLTNLYLCEHIILKMG